ncbi:Hypoxanthine-guanine phosphoribosyltransferase [Echinococcus granulosus]|uniref:Hypoxanthine phosphoribosyltransferase n=1 Tax=Echinococcus granulosus TaxID=6210 RepID=W6UDN4_ECHGR|nr:Hypoxanthine-guanine phosphoribosyltransferase [Echinococcus granulosus]EUB59153.1 Hypoxanthine-guanine phosphoribosyltransferase [Echinococcus granulosus]KAH9286671.1 Hypoxanthine-guanine phosphoribosyltransferase [Echinococcus granulosus]
MIPPSVVPGSDIRDSEPVNLANGFSGFPTTAFCIPERYVPYLDKVLVSNGMIKDRLQRLAAHIVESYEHLGITNLSIMCVLKGGFKFFSDLIDELQRIIWSRSAQLCIAVEFIRVKSYTDTVSGTVGIRSIDNAMPIKDKNILIVDDICDTGKTMVKLSDYLTEAGAKSVMTCCLLLKHTKLNIGYRPDFLGFEIPDQFIVGYAIDYNECFRDLSHICSINEKAKLSFTSHRDIELGKLPAPTL